MRLHSNLALLVLTLLWRGFALAAEDPAAAQRELDQVNEAMVSIQLWLEEAGRDLSNRERRLREAEQELATVSQGMARLQRQIANTEAELDSLQQRQEALNNERAAMEDMLGQALRAAYMTSEENFLKLLLNQEDLSSSARMLHYARLFSAAQLETLESYRQTLEEIGAVNTGLETQLTNLVEQRTGLERQALALTTARAERAAALAELSSDISGRNAELERLARNQAELQTLIEEIRRAMEGIRSFADVPPFDQQRGRLPPPLDAPLVSRFGSRYGDGNLVRQGITFAVEPGTPVRAVHAGHIVFANWLRGMGLLVIVDHGDGYMSLYGANEALAASAGDWVDAGDVLATSGRGGDGNSPGLYFEIRQRGTATDPADWLRLP